MPCEIANELEHSEHIFTVCLIICAEKLAESSTERMGLLHRPVENAYATFRRCSQQYVLDILFTSYMKCHLVHSGCQLLDVFTNFSRLLIF
jgi:regulator of PEP synthase PpsR (kinase-PPPase family)